MIQKAIDVEAKASLHLSSIFCDLYLQALYSWRPAKILKLSYKEI